MNKVLILGAGGTLGGALVREFSLDYKVLSWDKEQADVTDFVGLESKIIQEKPDLIINAVAYNAVHPVEDDKNEQTKALLLNAEVPGKLAAIAKKLGAVFVHYSTDYVFDGASKSGYSEADLPQPINFYGHSKYLGEKSVSEVGGSYYLIRLSRLFGEKGTSAASKKSFVDIMFDKINEPVIKAVNEELSSPTYAPDVALFTRSLIEENKPVGIYHGANSGACTWYEFALEIFKILGKKVNLVPVKASEFPRKAALPRFSVLLSSKMPKQRSWQEALSNFLKNNLC